MHGGGVEEKLYKTICELHFSNGNKDVEIFQKSPMEIKEPIIHISSIYV